MLLLSGNGPFWQSEHAAAISVKNMGSRNTVQLVADDASSEIRSVQMRWRVAFPSPSALVAKQHTTFLSGRSLVSPLLLYLLRHGR